MHGVRACRSEEVYRKLRTCSAQGAPDLGQTYSFSQSSLYPSPLFFGVFLRCICNNDDNNNNNNNNNNRIQRRRELSPTSTLKRPGRNRVQITCNTSNAYHVQVSCYVPLGTKGQLSC